MDNNKCSICRYAQPDPTISNKDWTAYQCTNQKSEYYKALLNVNVNGDMLSRITWPGCPLAEGREKE